MICIDYDKSWPFTPKPINNFMPHIAIVGNQLSDMDAVGKWLGLHTNFCYAGSLYDLAKAQLSRDLTTTRAFHEREWYADYQDPIDLVREQLTYADIIIGLRDVKLLKRTEQYELFDLVIWIECIGLNEKFPTGPETNITASDCDVSIDNTTTYDDLYRRLKNFCAFANIDYHE